MVAGKAAAPVQVGIKRFDSQSDAGALVAFLRKRTAQHIRWG